jgi:ubiquinone/menaquinone biosynthesis C-methylase UbiE
MDTCKADAQDEASRTETALVRQRYDRAAGAYDVMTWPMEALAMDRYRRRLIAQLQGTRVLEVGVGTGRNLSLYPDTAHVDAIDFSPRMLERARHRPARANIDLALMDVEQLEWPSESFDSVVSTCVFCSVPNPLRGLMEIRRVLRAGGRALFLEHMRPGAAWLAAIFDWLDPLVARRGPHINRRTMETIRAAGLVVDREENLMSDVLKLVIAHPW